MNQLMIKLRREIFYAIRVFYTIKEYNKTSFQNYTTSFDFTLE